MTSAHTVVTQQRLSLEYEESVFSYRLSGKTGYDQFAILTR